MKIRILMSAFIVFTLLINACSSNKKEEAKAEEAISGYNIFKKHCINCHGADGKMGLNGAKPIPESKMTLEERITHITNGKGAMQPYKGILKPEEIKAVAEYTFELK